MCAALRHISFLSIPHPPPPHFFAPLLTGDWPTRAMSVVERMRRSMGTVVDNIQENVQKKAEYLGYGMCAVTPEKIPEKWSITLFSEELVRVC